MPFSKPVQRKIIHSRRISCDGYFRDDGLIDVEAHLIDTRGTETPLLAGDILPIGGILHGMGIRVTVDDEMIIQNVECILEHGPSFECKQIGEKYNQLIGLQIGGGFSATIKKIFKGESGCTHLTELLIPMATTALQVISTKFISTSNNHNLINVKIINSCHSFRQSGAAVKLHAPEYYKEDD